MKRGLSAGILLVLIVLFVNIGLVSASFTKGNLSAEIHDSYSPEENIKGWINISLQNEPTNSLVSVEDTDFNGNISLLSFLESNELTSGDEFVCVPSDCEKSYETTGSGGATKTFNLVSSQEKILGFKVSGENVNIQSLKFNVQSNAQASCYNQLELDLLEDDDIEWKNSKSTNEICLNKNYGCFQDAETRLADITEFYCEQINLTTASAFELGAWIKKGTTSWHEGLLKMKLYKSGNEEAECNLTQPTTEGSEISCRVDYQVKEKGNYFVCVSTDNEGGTNYQTKAESSSPCGFNNEPSSNPEFVKDYQIFAQPYKYDAIGSFEINESVLGEEETLAEYIDSYINEKYERNCSLGCVLPVKLVSKAEQQVSLTNVELKYSETGISSATENKIYETTKSSAKINSDFLILDLEKAEIKVPSSYGNHTLELMLDYETIVSKKISVIELPIITRIIPTEFPAGMKIKFILDLENVYLDTEVSGYNWDFGDGENETTLDRSVEHVYENIGEYELEVSVETSKGTTSKKFQMSAVSPESMINETIIKYKERLNKIEVSSQGKYYSKIIGNATNLDELKSEVARLERAYDSAQTTEEYNDIMLNLTYLEVPVSINRSKSSILKFFDVPENINVGYIAEISGAGTKEADDETIKTAIVNWFLENIDGKLKKEVLSLYYEDKVEPLVSIFELTISPKKSISYDIYLVIDEQQEGIIFRDSGMDKKIQEGTYINLGELGQEKKIEFVIAEEAEPSIYISPELKKLELEVTISPCNYNGKCEEGESTGNCRADCKPYGWMIFWIVLLVILAFLTYIFLQEWYKRNYEKSLFKNSNELYNLISFIDNAKKQGLGENEIKGKLKKAGWKSEQINYALRKYKGERTGMFEIPIFRIFEKKKVQEEIAKRQDMPRLVEMPR